MSTNTALDQIKNRAEKAVDARLECNNAETDEQEQFLSIKAAFIAEQSSYDVPKLLAALEAVEALHYADAEVDGLYPQACSEGPCEHEDDCPEVTITPCYECSTPGWDYVAWPCPTIKAIEEALR